MPPIREFEIFCGDCRDILPTLPRLADACICDPPYGLKFMGKGWDHGVPGVPYWKAVLNACKPGAHLLAFGGTRTFHRLTCAIEDAGWEIRDCIMWVYGSGFPKSRDISKALDKAAGAEREVVGTKRGVGGENLNDIVGGRAIRTTDQAGARGIGAYGTGAKQVPVDVPITAPATPLAAQWDGWGTALKPAWEPIILARKPLSGTVAQNVQAHGCGALNIDGCRVEGEGGMRWETPRGGIWTTDSAAKAQLVPNDKGRWPANLIHDGSDEVVGLFPQTKSGAMNGVYQNTLMANKAGVRDGKPIHLQQEASEGSAARFFYCAKASKQDRDEGCESMPAVKSGMSNGAQLHGEGYDKGQDIGLNRVIQRRNHHPTVKPTALMRYLVKLVSRPGHTILDPFSGSGSTGKAAILEARQFLGIELQPEYVQIATARLSHAVKLHQESSAQQNLL